MTKTTNPSDHRLAEMIAGNRNDQDTGLSQQQQVISNALTGNTVVQMGVIPSTSGAPGPAGPRYGIRFFNAGTPPTLSIAGSPTGGSFELTDVVQTLHGGSTGWGSASIAYDATAADVAAAMNALSGASGYTASGGPLPGTAIEVTPPNGHALAIGTNSLTGGDEPTPAVTGWTDPLLQVQIDEWGWHLYSGGEYTSELVTY